MITSASETSASRSGYSPAMTTARGDRRVFPEISSRAWEHPADRTALVTLRKLQGFDTVLKTLSGLLRERQHRLLYLATAVRVGETQFRELHRLRAECVETLDLGRTPELYVVQDPKVNAMTIGMDTPFIVMTTGLLGLLDIDELRFVMGHEIGHAQSGHAVYRTILMHLMRMAGNVGWIPVGGWALRALIAALMEWQRKSELSGDRAGLLCAQDVDAAIRVQLKLAGGSHVEAMNVEAFLAQAAEYDATGDLRDGVLKLLNLELQSHPFSVLRAAELTRWIGSGEYGAILAGGYPRRADDAEASIADEARAAARGYKANFDASQDPVMKTLRDVGKDVGSAVDTVAQNVGDFASDLGRRISNWRKLPDDDGPQRPGEPDRDTDMP